MLLDTLNPVNRDWTGTIRDIKITGKPLGPALTASKEVVDQT